MDVPENPPSDVVPHWSPSAWWATHDRPAPGTRVLLRNGRRGTVTRYEGWWQAVAFPVLLDGTGQTLMLVISDVTVLTPATQRPDAEAAHPTPTLRLL